jgi:uncharacterized membrane protein YphA (DoxX/SURF4 family)
VLRVARGPVAPLYHAYLPDFHGLEGLLHGDQVPGGPTPLNDWTRQVEQDWESFRQKFVANYGLTEEQQKQAEHILEQYRARLEDWAEANEEAAATHIHQWQRKEAAREMPAGNLPFQKKRTTEKQSQLTGEMNGWLAELKVVERGYENALNDLLSDDDRAQRPLPRPSTSLDTIDGVMTYGILGIGLLLLVGLFTRLACLAGALFLLSVVMMQPFWVSETMPTYNQWVEMFALLTLATTPVGRWAGLDFFLAHLFWGSSSTKGKTDVPKT